MSSPFSDFLNLSIQLLNNIKIISSDNKIETYVDVCKSFINKYPSEYLNMYKTYIYIKKSDIANFNYSIVKNNKDWTNELSNNKNINIKSDNLGNVFNLIFKEWDSITENNKNAIFTYLKYMDDIIEKFNL